MKKIFFLFFLIFSLVLIPKSPLVFAQDIPDIPSDLAVPEEIPGGSPSEVAPIDPNAPLPPELVTPPGEAEPEIPPTAEPTITPSPQQTGGSCSEYLQVDTPAPNSEGRYAWVGAENCSIDCQANETCPQNTTDPAVRPETSAWCSFKDTTDQFGKCIQLRFFPHNLAPNQPTPTPGIGERVTGEACVDGKVRLKSNQSCPGGRPGVCYCRKSCSVPTASSDGTSSTGSPAPSSDQPIVCNTYNYKPTECKGTGLCTICPGSGLCISTQYATAEQCPSSPTCDQLPANTTEAFCTSRDCSYNPQTKRCYQWVPTCRPGWDGQTAQSCAAIGRSGGGTGLPVPGRDMTRQTIVVRQEVVSLYDVDTNNCSCEDTSGCLGSPNYTPAPPVGGPGTSPAVVHPTAAPTPFPNNYQIESCVGKSTTETVSVIAGRCASGNGYYYNHCKCKGDNTSAADVTKCTADSPPQRTCGQTNSDPEKQRQEVAFCQTANDANIGRAVPGSENCSAKCAGETTASGACKGHQYCVWSPDGNHYAGVCQCEVNGAGKTCIGSETKPAQPTSRPNATAAPTLNTTTTPAPTVANDEKPAVTGFSVNRTTVLAGDSGLTFSASGGRGRFILSLYGGGAAPTSDDDPKVKCAENILSEECEIYDPNGFVNGTAKTFRIRDTGGDYNNLSSTNLSPNAAPTTPGNYYALVVAKYKGLTCSAIEKVLISSEGAGDRKSCQNTGIQSITVNDASVTSVSLPLNYNRTPTTVTIPVTIQGQAKKYDVFISWNAQPNGTDFSNAPRYNELLEFDSGRPYYINSTDPNTTGQAQLSFPTPKKPGTYFVLVNAHSTNNPWSTYDRVCAFNTKVYQDSGNSNGTSISEVTRERPCRNFGAQASFVVTPPATPTIVRAPTVRPAVLPTCRPGQTTGSCATQTLPRRQPLIVSPAAQPVQQVAIPILSGILNFLSNIFK